MMWLRKLLDRGRRQYRGSDFHVRLEPIFREVISVIHSRHGTTLNLSGEYIGKRWEGIGVSIPLKLEAAQASQIASDLATAFQAMGYGYVITRKVGVDVVPESERQAAIHELYEMGYEIDSPRWQNPRDKESRCAASGYRNNTQAGAAHDVADTVPPRNTSAR